MPPTMHRFQHVLALFQDGRVRGRCMACSNVPKAEMSIWEGLPGVLGNKGTLAKYRREQGNISQFLGTREQNSKNYSTKKF